MPTAATDREAKYQIYLIGHDFEDDNVVSVSGWPIAPEPLRRRLQMGSHAVKAVGQFLLHPFEIFPSKGLTFVVGARQQDLHKMHDEEQLKTLNGHIGIRVPGMLGAAKGGNAGPQARQDRLAHQTCSSKSVFNDLLDLWRSGLVISLCRCRRCTICHRHSGIFGPPLGRRCSALPFNAFRNPPKLRHLSRRGDTDIQHEGLGIAESIAPDRRSMAHACYGVHFDFRLPHFIAPREASTDAILFRNGWRLVEAMDIPPLRNDCVCVRC